MAKFLIYSGFVLGGLVVIALLAAVWNQYDLQRKGDAVPVNAELAVIRTPEARFTALTDFPFEPHYFELADPELGAMRVHYLDEGPEDGEVILLLHGQATWSYSFRDMIPLRTEAGYRVIVPDMVGFGRSDKPADWNDHTFERHVRWLDETLQALNIENATGFLFDWGGYFGLRVMADRPEVFSRVVLVTTTLPRAQGLTNAVWVAGWRRYIYGPDQFPISGMVQDMTDNVMEADTLAGLDAPYPDESYKGGPRRMPMMIPATFLNPSTDANRSAWAELGRWEKPTLVLVSERLARQGFNPQEFYDQLPGTAGQEHATYPDTGFFLIEDAPEALALKTLAFIAANQNRP